MAMGIQRVGGAILLAMMATPLCSQNSRGLFVARCAVCHGLNGKGVESMTKGSRLTIADLNVVDGPTLAKSDEQLFQIVLNGKKPMMPMFKGRMTEQEIRNVIAALRNLDGAKDKQIPPQPGSSH
jgi:mono/diheme cytochrome c family protein